MQQIIFNIILASSFFLLVACSASILKGAVGFLGFGQAATISLGAYFVFLFSQQLHIPFAISILGALICCVCVDLAVEIFLFRTMRNKNLKPYAMVLASLGVYITLQNLISLYFGDDARSIRLEEITIGHKILGAYFTSTQAVSVFTSIAFVSVVSLFLHFTALGKATRAVASNPTLSNSYGILPGKVILITTGIGSCLSAIVGILSALDTNMTPTFGFNFLLYGIVAMIIGGGRGMKGLIAGSVFVATMQHLFAYYFDSKWMDVAVYVVLILFLIYKPLGFSGARLKKVEV